MNTIRYGGNWSLGLSVCIDDSEVSHLETSQSVGGLFSFSVDEPEGAMVVESLVAQCQGK
jgi:hypothetical protein